MVFGAFVTMMLSVPVPDEPDTLPEETAPLDPDVDPELELAGLPVVLIDPDDAAPDDPEEEDVLDLELEDPLTVPDEELVALADEELVALAEELPLPDPEDPPKGKLERSV
jgi:hypothetical protein